MMLSKRHITIIALIAMVVVLGLSDLFGQPRLETSFKARVYRLTNNLDGVTYEASGVVFSEGNWYFLITNKHFVQPDGKKFIDSIEIYMNKILPNGDVISGPEKRKIKLQFEDKKRFFVSENCDIDLALIPFSRRNSEFEVSDSLYAIKTESISSTEALKLLQASNDIVTVIGYPGKVSILPIRTPEYTWGDSLRIESNRVLYNAPTSEGSSGSIVLMHSRGVYYLLGIHYGHFDQSSIGIAVPTDKISECFGSYFQIIRMRNGEKLKNLPKFQLPSEFPSGSAARTLSEYVLAWRENDWGKMATLTQKTWLSNHPDAPNLMKAWYDQRQIFEFEITEIKCGEASCKIKYVVKYNDLAHSNKIVSELMGAFLVKETEPFNPSPQGIWGVNPVSTWVGEIVD